MSAAGDRRSARGYDVLLRAFLKRRGWRGGRRALADALPAEGRLKDGDAFARTLDRIGYRCRWRSILPPLLTPGDLPVLAESRRGPLLVTRIDAEGAVLAIAPDAPQTEFPLSISELLRILIVVDGADECRSSLASATGDLPRIAGAAAGLTVPLVVCAAFGPSLARATASGGGGEAVVLGVLALGAVAAGIVRNRMLARACTKASSRLSAIAVERVLHAPLEAPANAPPRFEAIDRFAIGGGLGAVFDASAAVVACVAALAIGGAPAIAPLFAVLALSLLLVSTRERSEALAVEAEDQDAQRFRRTDRASGVDAAARGVAGFSFAALLTFWALDTAAFADLAGLALAFWLATGPLMALAARDVDLADATAALTAARGLDALPIERRRLTRMAMRNPAAVNFRDVAAYDPLDPAHLVRIGALDIPPGEAFAFIGARGSGASAALAAIVGLAAVERGHILVGGRDVRAIDRVAFRVEIAALGRRTILPEIGALSLVRRLAPFADDHAVEAAFDRAGLRGLGIAPETIVRPNDPRFDASVRWRIALAGALARRAPLLAIDCPDAVFDEALDALLCDHVSAMRGRATIILATNRPALVRSCDSVAAFERGRLAAVGGADLLTPSGARTASAPFASHRRA